MLQSSTMGIVDSHQLGCKSSQGDHSSAEIHLHQVEHCCHLPAELRCSSGMFFWTLLVVGRIQVGKKRKPLQFCNDCHVRVKKTHTIWDFLRCFGTALQTTRVKHLGVPSNLCTTSAVCRLGRDCHRKPKFLQHQFHVRLWVLLSDDSRTYYVTSANFSE